MKHGRGVEYSPRPLDVRIFRRNTDLRTLDVSD